MCIVSKLLGKFLLCFLLVFLYLALQRSSQLFEVQILQFLEAWKYLWSEDLWLFLMKTGGAAGVWEYLQTKLQYFSKKDEAQVQLSLLKYQRKICLQLA